MKLDPKVLYASMIFYMTNTGVDSKWLANSFNMNEGQKGMTLNTNFFSKDYNVCKACLQSLHFPEMNSRKNDIADPTETTYGWLSKHQKYQEWLLRRRGMLWIKGKPGAGKSTLLRYALASMEKQQPRDRSIVASFFFHGRGALIQRSPLGLFKSLLHQILQHVPRLLIAFHSLFKKKCDAEGGFGQNWDWQDRDLQDFFKHHVLDAAKICQIILYIDALDECGQENATKLVDFFRVLSSSNSEDASLRICFSCRHYPLISLNDGFEICVEEENHHDIEIYTQDVIERHIQSKDHAQEVQREIVSRSSGNFQWVVLVVPRALRSYNKGRYKGMKKILQATPIELHELYESLLKEVDLEDLPSTLQLMQWICFALSPLSIKELRYATIVDVDTPYESIKECQETEEYAETDEEMEKRILDLSKGLAEIKEHGGKRVAQFIHQSVNDYMVENGLSILGKTSSASATGLGHFRLSRSCIKYMLMEDIRCYYETLDQRYSTVRRRRENFEEEFPFLRYAVSSWILHAEKVEQEGLSQEDLVSYFQSSKKTFQLWINLYRYIVELAVRRPASGTTLLHIASRTTLLHVASTYNLCSVVKSCFGSSDVVADSKDDEGRTPLSRAAEMGHEAVLRMLLTRDDVAADSKNGLGHTPLSWAASGGHEAVVRLLLTRDDVTASSRNRALFRARARWSRAPGHKAVIRLLLARNNVVGEALLRAAEKGQEAVVRLMLTGDVVTADFKCRALYKAVVNKHEAVERLLRRDISLSGRMKCCEDSVKSCWHAIDKDSQISNS